MASITIRKLDERTKARLRVRAAQHGRSMEEEARTLLRAALTEDIVAGGNLADAIRARFRRLRGVELRLPAASRCESHPSLADDRPRYERAVGVDETGAGREGRRVDGRPAGAHALHDQHHASRDPPWLDAPSTGPTPQCARSRGHVHVRGGLRRSDPRIRHGRGSTLCSDCFRSAARRPSHLAFRCPDRSHRTFGGRRLATRNLPDFEGCGVTLVDPWAV